MRNRILIIASALLVLIAFWLTTGSKEKKPAALTTENVDLAKSSVQELYSKAKEFLDDRELLKAKEIFQSILSEHPDYENIENIQEELGAVNTEIIFSNALTPKSVIHEVQSGDTLGEIAKKYGTTIDLIKANNHLKSDIIRIGQRLRVWIGKFNILVDKSQNVLLLRDEDEVVKVYRVSTGADNNTPVGEFTIVDRLVDPVWFNKGIVVPPESPQNVLGSRWLGFDIPGYGIHGTIDPGSIGSQVTAGCVRMRNSDIEEIFTMVPSGTKVTIID